MGDPRNPDPNHMVICDSSSNQFSVYPNFRKTLVLLMIDHKEAPVYFVVEGLSHWPTTYEELIDNSEYFYNEHTCPTNFIRIPMISHKGDADPHGILEFVDAVWMLDEYDCDNKDGYLMEVFPQLRADHGQS